MIPPLPMPTTADVRVAMRALHAALPEPCAVVQAHVDGLEERVQLLSSDDAFRAYLLARARQDGAVLHLLRSLDDSVLAQLAAGEKARGEAELLSAKSRQARSLTTRQVLTQPVVLAVVGILSTAVGGVMTLILHFAGAQ